MEKPKKGLKVIYMPNQYDPKKFKEGCRLIM